MIKKYELTDETMKVNNVVLHRIKALKDFGTVKAGDLGGWIEKEDNLSQDEDCWVKDDARVYENAGVSGNALAYDNAQIYENTMVFRNARVSGNAQIYGNARVFGNAQIFGNAWVTGNAQVFENALIYEDGWVFDIATVSGDARVFGNAQVYGNARVSGNAVITSKSDYTSVQGFGTEGRSTTFFKTKDGISVNCGCFHGTLEQFREQVKKTREGKIAEEYLTIADFMEKHFKD